MIWELAPLKGRTTTAAGLVPILFVVSLDKFGLGENFSVERMKIDDQFSSLSCRDGFGRIPNHCNTSGLSAT